MKIILTGATGMVGEGVLLECLNHSLVEKVLMINRRSYPIQHPKLEELLVADFMKLDLHAGKLSGYDGCFYCAGVSSVGLSEEKYTRITYDTTMAFARVLATINPQMVFTFVTGAHTDSTEKGRSMWARVKGRTENDLIKLPFRAVYNFRPGFMKPYPGQKNIKTLFKIFIPVLSLALPKKMILTLSEVGRAMINAVAKGYTKPVLEVKDIRQLASIPLS
jgi:uncharacterized protein YbjT (DUF2867 family)